MYKIVALVGEAGSGKDRMMQEVLKSCPLLHEIISCTTRPMREGEKHGVNYFYLTPEQFGDLVLHDEMLECTVFRDWFYGTSYESVRSDCVNIGVFNPVGVEALLERKDVEVKVFRVRARDKTRLLRQLNREENPDVHEIVRRFNTDWMDFAEFEAPCVDVQNESMEDLKAGVEQILSQLEPWLAQGQN